MGKILQKLKSAIVGPRQPASQAAGSRAEDIAAGFLHDHGVRLVARNVRYSRGEIDLIGLDGETLIFVEVRLRRNAAFGGAAASITPTKQARIVLAARLWLAGHGRSHAERACRFDAILLDRLHVDAVQWLHGAFDAD